MVLGADEADELPLLAPAGFCSLIALILVFWVLARVSVARSQLSRGQEPSTRIGFIRALAVRPALYRGLMVLAAGLAAAAWFLR